jgi:molybdate transport system regulatory protein
MASRRRATAAPSLKSHLTLETPLGAVLSDSRIRLLEAIERIGSLNRAAREVPLSYKAAWDALQAMSEQAPEPLVERQTGGAGGGGTRLTDYARRLIALYRAMESTQQDILDRLPGLPALDTMAPGEGPDLRMQLRRLQMRSSARNQFAAGVAALVDRGGLTDVVMDLLPDESGQAAAMAMPDRIIATITPESAQRMGLRRGSVLYALVKAPWVTLSRQPPRRAAERNQLQGQISALRPGVRHTGVTLRLNSGRELHAAIPARQAEGLQPGDAAWGLFDTESVVLVSFA